MHVTTRQRCQFRLWGSRIKKGPDFFVRPTPEETNRRGTTLAANQF